VLLVLLSFGLEETYFNRRTVAAQQQAAVQTRQPESKFIDEKKSYWKSIAVITPADNLVGYGFKQYLGRLWLILQAFSFPPVLFAGLCWGTQVSWLTFYSKSEGDTWVAPPWNYDNDQVAIMNVPNLIGALIGCYYSGYISEYFVLWMTRRNGGVREAEFRLYTMLIPGLISPVGMILFGMGTQRGWNWPLPYFGLGLIGFGWGCSGDISMSYQIDAYPSMVFETMVAVGFMNPMLGMIFSFVCSSWFNALGIENTYISIAAVEFFVMVFLCGFMIVFGKKFRIWTSKRYYDIVEKRDAIDQL
jgi:predicted small integral membrane protein